MSWTDAAFGNGFLALDRNGNGRIDDANELFGNLTPQPLSSTPNGFAALAVFDGISKGGNENGLLDPGDSAYWKIVVWIDSNHDGISQPDELHSLLSLGIKSISLNFKQDDYTDRFGNQFRFSSTIADYQKRLFDKHCYDVFLVLSH